MCDRPLGSQKSPV